MSCAEEFYEGGITAFTIQQKVGQLNIDTEEAKVANGVSQNIVEKMALNVAGKFNTPWSVATTGYCKPVIESGYDIYAYYAIAYKGKVLLSERIDLDPRIRAEEAQNYFAECILSALVCQVKKNMSPLADKNIYYGK